MRGLLLWGLARSSIGVSYFKSCLGLIVDERKFIHDKPKINGGSPLMGPYVFSSSAAKLVGSLGREPNAGDLNLP